MKLFHVLSKDTVQVHLKELELNVEVALADYLVQFKVQVILFQMKLEEDTEILQFTLQSLMRKK